MDDLPRQPDAAPGATAPADATLSYREPHARATPGVASTYRVTRQMFLRGLGVVYLIAFGSLLVQVDGLIGTRGLLPVGEYLPLMRTLDPHPYRHNPTLLWLAPSSDAALHVLCAGGVILSLLVVAGLVQAPALALLWACYLSLVVVGQ